MTKDVGELKRLVNVLLQAIDEWPSTSVLIAATNHQTCWTLQRGGGLKQRFASRTPIQLIEGLLIDAEVSPRIAQQLAVHLQGNSFSDINRIVLTAKKRAVLDQRPVNDTIIDISLKNLAPTESAHCTRDMRIIQLSLQGYPSEKSQAS